MKLFIPLNYWPAVLGTILASSVALRAHEAPKAAQPAGHGQHAHTNAVQAKSAAGAWATITRAAAQMEIFVKERRLDGVHDQTDAMTAALEALPALTSDVSAQKKRRLDAAVRQAISLADNLHEAADGAEQNKAEAELKKLLAGLQLVEAQLPADVVQQAKEEASQARSTESREHAEHALAHGHETAPEPTIAVEIRSPESLRTGHATRLVARLTTTANLAPVGPDALQVAHTRRVHLLVIDGSLTDYQHIHPEPVAGKPGDWAFEFTPRAAGTYKVFADLLPAATGAQEYSAAEFDVVGAPLRLDRSLNRAADVNGYRFVLESENNAAFTAGEATLVTVEVAGRDGKPFRNLEPLMGAFAHGVGFAADRASVLHVHPMGRELEHDADRGGPELAFHILPEQPDFMKFFVQVQIEGQDHFASFGLDVKPAGLGAAPVTRSYECPMKCAVSDRAGKCPRCGMDLVKRS